MLSKILKLVMTLTSEIEKAGQDKRYTVDEILDIVKVAIDTEGYGDFVLINLLGNEEQNGTDKSVQ